MGESDPEYWERGSCYAVDADSASDEPSMVAWRASEGWHIERAQQQEQSTPSVSRDGAPPAGYLASPGWGHIFVGESEQTTRWIYACATGTLVAAQVYRGVGRRWIDLDVDAAGDLLKSLRDNDIEEKFGDFEVCRFEAMPTWQEVEGAFAVALPPAPAP